jgi:hypothetical protein
MVTVTYKLLLMPKIEHGTFVDESFDY